MLYPPLVKYQLISPCLRVFEECFFHLSNIHQKSYLLILSQKYYGNKGYDIGFCLGMPDFSCWDWKLMISQFSIKNESAPICKVRNMMLCPFNLEWSNGGLGVSLGRRSRVQILSTPWSVSLSHFLNLVYRFSVICRLAYT